MNVLELQHAGVRFGERDLVRDLSATIAPGQVTALVGPNGSGKSTMLRLLCGLWQPTSGRVLLGGKDLAGWSPRARAREVAWVPQDTRMQYDFTVAEVVAMGRYPHERRLARPSSADQAIVEAAMARADVTRFADRSVMKLSGGERQRVLIARSLATEAPTILLDEPTSSLDLAHGHDVLTLCQELAAAGRAIAVAIHDLSLAMRYADMVVMLKQGRLVSAGPAAEVLTAEQIQAVFDVQAMAVTGPDGGAALVFARRT